MKLKTTKNKHMENKFIEIITDSQVAPYKTNSPINIMDSTNKKHLLEINKGDNSVLVSREFIWDVFKNDFNLSDKQVQNFLNEMVQKYFELNNKFICNRMIF